MYLDGGIFGYGVEEQYDGSLERFLALFCVKYRIGNSTVEGFRKVKARVAEQMRNGGRLIAIPA
jgi:hypothetical protein